MTHDQNNTCQTCTYWSPNPNDPTLGLCRRHAPPIPNFPSFRADWCGQHSDTPTYLTRLTEKLIILMDRHSSQDHNT